MTDRRPYLTKKRLAALHTALSIDDILYEKFRRLHERLNEDARRLIHNRKRVFRVIRMGENHNDVLQIADVVMTEEGSTIYVR